MVNPSIFLFQLRVQTALHHLVRLRRFFVFRSSGPRVTVFAEREDLFMSSLLALVIVRDETHVSKAEVFMTLGRGRSSARERDQKGKNCKTPCNGRDQGGSPQTKKWCSDFFMAGTPNRCYSLLWMIISICSLAQICCCQ